MTRKEYLAALSILLACTTAPAPAGADGGVTLPLLPVTVLLKEGGRANDFCASAVFAQTLGRRTFESVVGIGRRPDAGGHDLTLICGSAYDAVSIQVKDRAERKTLYSITVKHDNDALTSRLIAQRLAQKGKVIAPALDAYTAFNRRVLPGLGERELKNGNWMRAAGYYLRALESDGGAAESYFGLSKAYAALGSPRRAHWYFLAYIAASGEDVESADLEPLRSMTGSPEPKIGSEESRLFDRWERESKARRWREAIETLKSLLEEAPWSDEAAKALSKSYGAMGWDRLEDIWKRRMRLTRKVNADRSNQKKLAELLSD